MSFIPSKGHEVGKSVDDHSSATKEDFNLLETFRVNTLMWDRTQSFVTAIIHILM